METAEYTAKMSAARVALNHIEMMQDQLGVTLPTETIREAMRATGGLYAIGADGNKEQKAAAGDLVMTLEIATISLIEHCYNRALRRPAPANPVHPKVRR